MPAPAPRRGFTFKIETMKTISTHPGPVALVQWEPTPAMERLLTARSLGQEAYRRGGTSQPDWDEKFMNLLDVPAIRPGKEALIAAWKYGWHLARLANIERIEAPPLPGEPIAIDIEACRAVVQMPYDPKRCSCPPEHYHGETTKDCCNECGLPVE